MFKKVRKAVFPVGGFGTRFLPASKAIPKEMLPVGNVPLVQRAFEEARSAGIEQFIFVLGRNKNAIINHFDIAYELDVTLSAQDKQRELESARDWLPDAGSTVFIRQQHPLGLGHAVLCAKDVVGDEPFAVILADELLIDSPNGFTKKLIDLYNRVASNVIAIAPIDPSDVNKYGIAKIRDEDKGSAHKTVRVESVIEKPEIGQAPSNLAIAGRYILQPSIFEALSITQPGKGGEIQLTDALNLLMKSCGVFGLIFEGERYDCGNPLGWIEANIASFFANPTYKRSVEKILKTYA